MLITTSIIFIVIVSLSDNEAARRLRFTPLLSSSKFPAFSAWESKGFFFENKKSRKRHTIAHK